MKRQFPIDPSVLSVAVLEASPDGVLVAKYDGTIVLANRQAGFLLGYDRDELLGQPIEVLVPNRHRRAHLGHRVKYERGPHRRNLDAVQDLVGLRRDGTEIPLSIALSPMSSAQGRFIICTLRDDTDARRLRQELERQSTRDELTQLYNRAFFEAELDRFDEGRSFPISVLAVDVDGLKPVNDHQGHAAGDVFLRRTAAVLRSCFRAEDVVARVGGDEFAVLLPELDAEGLRRSMDRLVDDIDRHNTVYRGGALALSFGGATAEGPGRLRRALSEADAAMYAHKRSKRRPSRVG